MSALPAPPARIAFWGNFGTLNLGNECTLAAAVGNIRARLPGARIMCACRDPADTRTRHRIEAVPIGLAGARESRGPKPLRLLFRVAREVADWVRTLHRLRGVDVLFIAGTGMLTDAGEGSLGLPYELFKWCAAARLRGGRVLFVSVGTESIERPLARSLITRALRLASYRSYRDRHSMDLLRSYGFPADRDTVVPDLAFSLTVPPPTRRPPNGKPSVAVGLFNYRGRGIGGGQAAADYALYIERISALIEWLLARDYPVRVVIGDLAYDADVRVDLRQALQGRGVDLADSRYADEPATSFEQLLVQLSEVDLVIASRYHNVLLSLMLGRPVLSISYEAKNEALMADMGLAAYCQTLDDLDFERLLAQFRELECNAAALRAGLAGRASVNRDLLRRQYERLVADFAGPNSLATQGQ